MALKLSDLSVLAYANNFTIWHYKTTDSSVSGKGYFNGGSDMMRAGDFLIVNFNTENGPENKLCFVTSISGGDVIIG